MSKTFIPDFNGEHIQQCAIYNPPKPTKNNIWGSVSTVLEKISTFLMCI